MSIVGDVYRFNKEIIGTEQPKELTNLSRERLLFALTAMYEELGEFTVAQNKGDIAESLDAIIDLIYFAIGRAYELGISEDKFNKCWSLVQYKNMNKKRGTKNRGTSQDAMKPEGWTAPNLSEVLDG